MPSVPGSLLDIITDQAGTGIGGSQLVSRPYMPRLMSASRLGKRPRTRSNTKLGSKQSRPITTIFPFLPFLIVLFLPELLLGQEFPKNVNVSHSSQRSACARKKAGFPIRHRIRPTRQS